MALFRTVSCGMDASYWQTSRPGFLRKIPRKSFSLPLLRCRKDVEKTANLVYSLDTPEEYWLWKVPADPEK